jgi:hypothetical protein
MKKNNPPKKLRLFKKTIAHLNNEQMHAAHGGEIVTRLFCSDTGTGDTLGCPTTGCGDSHTDPKLTEICV